MSSSQTKSSAGFGNLRMVLVTVMCNVSSSLILGIYSVILK